MSLSDKQKADLEAWFPVDVVHWRPGSTNKDKDAAMALAYVDARDVMDRLDEVVGPAGWQNDYPDAGNGKTCCRIGIEIDGQWVWKSDGAGDTGTEGDKGAFSDAFKRAAVRWGVGRYLYGMASPWVPIQQRGKSYVFTPDAQKRLTRFYVDAMGRKASDHQATYDQLLKSIEVCADEEDLQRWGVSNKDKIASLPEDWRKGIQGRWTARRHKVGQPPKANGASGVEAAA